MGALSLRVAVVVSAVILGYAGAVAVADDHPVLPKNLPAVALGAGAGVSYDASDWTTVEQGLEWSLTLPHPTYVRGPAVIRVIAGTHVEIPAGSVVLVSWEPAIRGWSFYAHQGSFRGVFPNTVTDVGPRRSITITIAGELFRAITGYSNSGVLGTEGLPEVSAFKIVVPAAAEVRR